jgi:uncharacterized protein HemY
MRKVSQYEEHAQECRRMAGKMQDAAHKKQLEEMAEAWEMLARERRHQLMEQVNGNAFLPKVTDDRKEAE